MTRGGLLNSKKYLAPLALALLTLLVLLSPKAHAAETACTTTPPSPYTNGAAVVRVFYPADGSTVTVTATGAVIKQSPCQTPYREGWVNPADICNLNSFDQLGGMINKSGANPNPNTPAVYSCTAGPPAMNTVTPPPATPPLNSNNVNVVQTVNTAPPPASNPPAAVRPTSTPVVQSATTTAPPATALPNTGTSSTSLVALGGIPAVLGTVGHFFYRRRDASY